jgi:hypothetical protein
MRKTLWMIALALSAIVAPTVVRAANITYTLNEAVGAGSVTGFITTDGTIGTLAAGNILDWNLILNDGTNPTFDLLGPLSGNNSGASVSADLSATATQLLYNFSGVLGNFFLQSPSPASGGPFVGYSSNFDCTGTGQGPTNGVCLSVLPVSGGIFPNLQQTVLTGDGVIASVVTTPEPSTGVLLFGGVGMVFVLVMRKRIAKGLPQAI